jgi:serine phosphatase RsbU (regulator of sigma subunit)
MLLLLVLGQSMVRMEHPTVETLVPTVIGYVAITGFVAGMSLVAISGVRQQIKSQVLSRDLAEAHTQIDADYRRLTEELELARQVQNRLIPLGTHHLPGLRFYSVYQPASAVGGDYFDCLTPKEGVRSTLLLGDVTGKGAGAALLMAAVKSVANTTETGRSDPARLLETLNTTLRSLSRQMMTLYTLSFAPDGESVLLANAGHLFPYRLRPGAPPLHLDQAQGLPLGALEIQRYQSASLAVTPGDRFVLYTDGIVEAADLAGTLFGFERLEGVLTAHGTLPAPDLAAEILAAVTTFRGAAALSDDITLVIVDIDSTGAGR